MSLPFTSSFITEQKIPLVIEPKKRMQHAESLEMLQEHKPLLREKLLAHGALLLRNFPFAVADDFIAVMDALGINKRISYIGGDSPRIKVKGGVYTSTEAPPSMKIPLHNELSFVKNYPKYICFFCETPSPVGGSTILGDARRIFQKIDKRVREDFEKRGLHYVSCYYDRSPWIDAINRFGKSHKRWIDVFETENRDEVERKCKENDFAFKWNKNNWLRISQKRPATLVHPETGENIWFNQVHLYDFNPKLLGWGKYIGAKLAYIRKHMRLHEVFFADGERIARRDLYHILEVLDEETIAFPWQKGDVLILDNISVMHGRAPFEGKRRVLTAMSH